MDYIVDYIGIDQKIPVVATFLNSKDKLGAIKARWAINRNNYKISPGIYAVGNPDEKAEVFVTANYKLSFDHLRSNITGINAWILVLDTKGINVWCAAGKGTFGTSELINRIKSNDLEKLVSHRKIILPQLGAVGVSAHEVKNESGFKVIYGPVRAIDIPSFVAANFRATESMRTVKFGLSDRLKLTPVELVGHFKYLISVLLLMILVGGFNNSTFSFDSMFENGIYITISLLSAYFGGAVLTPLLLPVLPPRSFSMKGLIVGIVLSIVLYFTQQIGTNIIESISLILIIVASTSFISMNFTGASTYTSLSGVKKEMKTAVPLQLIFFLTGLLTWITLRFI
jgi:hypothetical protein